MASTRASLVGRYVSRQHGGSSWLSGGGGGGGGGSVRRSPSSLLHTQWRTQQRTSVAALSRSRVALFSSQSYIIRQKEAQSSAQNSEDGEEGTAVAAAAADKGTSVDGKRDDSGEALAHPYFEERRYLKQKKAAKLEKKKAERVPHYNEDRVRYLDPIVRHHKMKYELQQPSTPVVVIQGASIAGLTLALALQQRGITADIVEPERDFKQHSARGVLLPVNAMRVLHKIGIGMDVAQQGQPIFQSRTQNSEGRTYGSVDLLDLARSFGDLPTDASGMEHPAVGIATETLLKLMTRKVLDAKLPFHLSTRATSWSPGPEPPYTPADRTRVHFSNRKKVARNYDVVVAADGHTSNIRQAFGKPKVEAHTFGTWHVTIPRPEYWDDLSTTEIWAQGSRLQVIPIDGNRLQVLVHVNTEDGFRTMKEGKRRAGRLVEHIESKFGPSVAKITKVLKDTPYRSAHVEYTTDTSMATRVIDNLVLLGSAGTHMAPYQGQREAMDIEDAYVLADTLAQCCDVHVDGDGNALDNEAPLATREALKLFEQRREKRLNMVSQLSSTVVLAGQEEVSSMRQRVREMTLRYRYSDSKLRTQAEALADFRL